MVGFLTWAKNELKQIELIILCGFGSGFFAKSDC